MAEMKTTGSVTLSPSSRKKLQRVATTNSSHKKSPKGSSTRLGRSFSSSGVPSSASRLGRALGSMKFRSNNENIAKGGLGAGNFIASQRACSAIVGEGKVVKFLRPSLAEKFNLFMDVDRRSSGRKSTKTKFYKKSVELKDGLVTLKLKSPKNQGGGGLRGSFKPIHQPIERECFQVFNIVDLKLLPSDSHQVQVMVFPGTSKKCDGSSNREKSNEKLIIYTFKLSSAKQAEFVAKTLLYEVENYATVIDLKLGYMETTGVKDEVKHLIPDLIRKRLDLFSIAKKSDSDCVRFAFDQFLLNLKDNNLNAEAKFWEKHRKEEDEEGMSDSRGLNALRDDLFGKRKEGKFNGIAEILEGLFFDVSKDVEIKNSYYVQLFLKGNLQEAN